MKSALAVLGMVGTGGATKPREIKEDKHIPPQCPEKKFKFPGKHSQQLQICRKNKIPFFLDAKTVVTSPAGRVNIVHVWPAYANISIFEGMPFVSPFTVTWRDTQQWPKRTTARCKTGRSTHPDPTLHFSAHSHFTYFILLKKNCTLQEELLCFSDEMGGLAAYFTTQQS